MNNGDMTRKPYRELLVCLIYITIGLRPDICFAVTYFSRLKDCASVIYWKHLKYALLLSEIHIGF